MGTQRPGPLWTLANVVTLLRLVLAAPTAYLIASSPPGPKPLALVLFVCAAATDGLDGYLARTRGEVSDAGKLLDPVADKVFGLAIFGSLVVEGLLPAWMLWLLIAKEGALLFGGIVILRLRNVVVSARRLGKAATVVLFIAFGALLAGLTGFGFWGTTLGVALSVGAGLDYARHAYRLLRD